MKFRHFLMAVLAVAAVAVSCKEEKDLGDARVELDPDTIELSAEAGASETIDLLATRKWTITSASTWLSFSPNGGDASADPQKVTITAKANTGTDRSAKVTFSIGLSEAVLTVKQKGDAGSEAEALVYKNDFDKGEDGVADKPALDKTDIWKNETGNGIADIKYEFKGISVRQTGQLSDSKEPKYSKYEGSGHNKLFFGTSAMFAVKEIALGGKTSFELSFGGNRYNKDDQDNTFNWNEFKVYVSIDGAKGVELPCTFAAGEAPNGAWDLASGKFSVPAGTEKLAVVFKVVDANGNSKYSLDDLKLIVAGDGKALDFSQAVSLGLDMSDQIPDSDDVTNLADVIASDPGTQVTVLNATVTAVNTRGYIISDGTNHIYVYIGKDANHGLKIGDKASIIGTFKYYKGEYEIVDASQKKVGTATAAYPEPEVLTPTNLTAYRQATPTDEDSPGYTGPWFPRYVKCTATVKKEGSYTNFVIEGYDKMLSLAFADSAMYKDASGTEYSDGNEVEILGYLLPWEAKTATSSSEYHPILAISLTGEATYVPVEATLEGDDVFVAVNEAHDRKVGNAESFTYPLVIGDASITIAGASNTGKYYTAGSAVRVGYGNTSKLTVSSARKIEKIQYLFAPSDKNGTYSPVEADLSKLFSVGSCAMDKENYILTWSGAASEVVLTYPLASGHYRVQEIAVSYGEDTEPRLAVAPAAIPVKADVTSAKFNVQSNIAWEIESDNENFVPSATEGENNAEITVTFPANESFDNDVVAVLTVSPKDADSDLSPATVTITQAKAIDQNQVTDLSKILANTADTKVEIYNVLVSAVNTKSFIVTDGTSSVYVDVNGTHTAKVGDKVNVSGTFKWYYGLGEISRGSDLKYEVKSSGNEVTYPAVTEMAGADFTGYESNPNKFPIYAKFTGTLAIVSGKYQFSMEGLSSYVSFVNPDSNVANDFVDGETAVVLGYYTGYHSGNKFHQFVYVGKDSGGEVAPFLRVNPSELKAKATDTEATFTITSNVAWTVTVPEGVASVVSASPASGEGNGTVKLTFPVNTGEERSFDLTVSGEGVTDVTIKCTQAAYNPDAPLELKLDFTTKTYTTDTATKVEWVTDALTMTVEQGTSTNNANQYLGGDSSNHTSSRMYKGNNLTLTPATGKKIVSIAFTTTTENYATTLNSTTWTNASSAVSGKIVTVTPTDGSAAISGAITGTVGLTQAVITYKN